MTQLSVYTQKIIQLSGLFDSKKTMQLKNDKLVLFFVTHIFGG